MDTFFKYKDKVFSTPNLEKKLKKMKLTLNDIEILPNNKKEEDEETEIDNKEYVRVYSTKDNIIRVVIVPKGQRPPLDSIFKRQGYSEEEISTLFYGGTL